MTEHCRVLLRRPELQGHRAQWKVPSWKDGGSRVRRTRLYAEVDLSHAIPRCITRGVDEERSVRGDTRHSDSRDNLHTKQQNTGNVPTTLKYE